MQFKSFMEALRGKQHKIDKNKNGQIDAQDFKLLRKEESELTEVSDEAKSLANAIASKHKNMKVSVERGNVMIHHKDDDEKIDRLTLSHTGNNKFHLHRTKSSGEDVSHRNLTADEVHKQAAKHIGGLQESEERMARADYKVGTSGRKSHKEIVFDDAESKDDEEDKKEMKEAKMSDADMAERERIVKGMKKNLAGFKARYGERAKEVMYATATKQAMKEETVEEAVQKADIPAYLRKQQGQTPLKLSDLKRKDTLSDKENLAKARNEEVEEIDEKSDQAKQNKTMKNMMDASRGARYKLNNPVPAAEPEHKTARAQNVAIGRALRSEEKKDDVPFEGPYTKVKANVKDKSGAVHTPMSRAKDLARAAMKKQMKEDIDRLFEAKDEQEYGYEGDMAMNQLATLTRCAEMIKDTLKPDTDLPEWVQSKITLATDYIVTAADYLHSELEEQAPVAPVPDKKYIKGTPEHKAYMATKKSRVGHPTSTASTHELSSDELGIKKEIAADRLEKKAMKMYKEESELDEVEHKTLSYTDFVATLLEYETKGGRYVHKGTYGGSYSDPEGADDADDKKPKQKSAEKRGRGRPAGAKSGAGKITGTSKLYK